MAIAIWLAQLLRRYLLLWVWSLVWRGWRRPLEAHDLPALPPGLTQSDARLAAELWWSDGEKANRRSIVGLTWRFHRREFLAGIAMSSCYGLCNVVLRPLLLKLTIEQVAAGVAPLRSVGLICAIGASLLFEGVCAGASRHMLSDRLFSAVFGMARRRRSCSARRFVSGSAWAAGRCRRAR